MRPSWIPLLAASLLAAAPAARAQEEASSRAEKRREEASSRMLQDDGGDSGEDPAAYAATDSPLRLTVSADPIRFSSRDDERELAYALKLDGSPVRGLTYAVLLRHEWDETVDRFAGRRIERVDVDAQGGVDCALSGRWSLTSHFSYERSRTGSFYDKRAEVHAALPGLKAHLPFGPFTTFDLSYAPGYNSLRHDVFGGPAAVERSLLHRLGLQASLELVRDRLSLGLDASAAYLDPLDAGTSGLQDERLRAVAFLQFSAGRNLRLTFTHETDYDSRQKRLFGQPSTQTTSYFQVSYTFALARKKA